MKTNKIILGVAAALTFGLSSCDNFLNCPTIDGYNVSNFYQNDEQCIQGVNYLYNSPWFDIIRGAISVGEVMSGNMYMGETGDYAPFLTFTVDGSNTLLKDYSYSLWAVNGHANTVINNLVQAQGPSQEVKNQCIGEALTWKAMAYFYLVRSFGDVPIVHDNGALLNEKDENGDPVFTKIEKVQKDDVYEYIVMTLEKAMQLLPKNNDVNTNGRIDYYTAEALLAKVWLARAGVSGSLNADYLKNAADAADDVIVNSGRDLMDNFEDIYRGHNNINKETLLAWRWKCPVINWTQQNALQADLSMNGFDEHGTWGSWNGLTVDLQEAFGVTAIMDPNTRIDVDTRRKATYMLAGDHYSYFWRDMTAPTTGEVGFDLLDFLYSPNYREGGPLGGPGVACYGGGAFCVKHLHGTDRDHEAEFGYAPTGQMMSSLATHLLRFSDVLLIYAEAKCLQGETGGLALERFNKVRTRAHAAPATSLTFDAIFKERRLEFACEGDRWFDFVRLAYYDEAQARAYLTGQKRYTYWGLDNVWKPYQESGRTTWDAAADKCGYDDREPIALPSHNIFQLPFPTDDVIFNGNMGSDKVGQHVNVREEYKYNF